MQTRKVIQICFRPCLLAPLFWTLILHAAARENTDCSGALEAAGRLRSKDLQSLRDARSRLEQISRSNSECVQVFLALLDIREISTEADQKRTLAEVALKFIRPTNRVAIENLIQKLDKSYPFQNRRIAAQVLGRIGKKADLALDRLLEVLKEDNDLLSQIVVPSLPRIASEGPRAEEVARELNGMLRRRSNPDLRSSIIVALGRIQSVNDKRATTEALNEIDRLLQIDPPSLAAIRAASNMGPAAEQVVPSLEGLLESKDYRSDAAEALGNIGFGARFSIRSLIQAFRDEDSEEDTQERQLRTIAEALGKIAQAVRNSEPIDTLDDLNAAHNALEGHWLLDVRKSDDQVKGAINDLKNRRRWEQLKRLLSSNPYIAAGISGYIFLYVFWLLVLRLRPLWLLRINDAIKFDMRIKASIVEISLPFRYAILVGFFNYHSRVLDAWVERHARAARESFKEITTVKSRRDYVPIPLVNDDRIIDIVEPGFLQEAFSRRKSCLLIYGEGGSGKTSLACKIAELAMLDDGRKRICKEHLILPVLMDQDLIPESAVGGKDSLLEFIRGQVTNLIDEPEPPSAELLRQLLLKKRILVVIDGLSEMSEYTTAKIQPGNPEFIINALIITSRTMEIDALRTVRKTAIRPLRIKGNQLSSFMDSYLIRRNKRELFGDEEFFDCCRRLSSIVGNRDITALIAKLFAEYMIGIKGQRASDGIPEHIPGLMLSYLNELNRRATHLRSYESIHRCARVLAWESLKRTHVPRTVKLSDLAEIVERNAITEDQIVFLEKDLGIIESTGLAKEQLRFTLDPLAEYLAALHLVERFYNKVLEYGVDEGFWPDFLQKADSMPGAPDSTREFLLAIRDCCLATVAEVKEESTGDVGDERQYRLHFIQQACNAVATELDKRGRKERVGR